MIIKSLRQRMRSWPDCPQRAGQLKESRCLTMAKIAPALIVLMMVSASSAARADSWYASWNHTSWNGGFGHGFNGRNDFWRGGYTGASFGHWSRPYRGWNHRYDRVDRWRSFDRGYTRGYRRGFRHGSRWSHGAWGYGDNQAASLLGGVVLGSLLTQTFSNQQVVQQPVVVSQRVVHSRPAPIVVRRTIETPAESAAPVRSATARPSTYLLRDLRGDCFVVERESDGTEIRSQVETARCEF